ncbi:MAG: type II toxin-antitoxin system HicB family antitoxin [Terriglobia bacterium]
MTFTARIWKDEDGYFVAQCEEFPGCVTQGKTLEEAKANFREALSLYLESTLSNGSPASAESVVPVERVRYELVAA